MGSSNPPRSHPPAEPARRKVVAACQRCRRQKLKCDPQRPCTLCTRTGTPCTSAEPTSWKVYSGQPNDTFGGPSPKRARRNPPQSSRDQDGSVPPLQTGDGDGDAVEHSASPAVEERPSGSTPRDEPLWNSSSTIALVEEAFQYHNSDTPPTSETSAFSTLQWRAAERNRIPRRTRVSRSKFEPPQASSAAALDFLALLPDREPATLLLNTYFDQVHWFMLVFHQEDFRRKFARLYDNRHDLQLVTTKGLVGFTSTLLAAFAITLQHAGAYRKNLLRGAGVDPEELKEKILTTLRVRFLDILSLGSLEVVQTCVLLGSYYLYYGRPELSWPICGCGLRIAQALNLHRKVAVTNVSAAGIQSNEVRKRAWWAVYEIETICSMLYGYPLTILERDCDVEPLDPHADQQSHRLSPLGRASSTDGATLLSYKYFMSKLLMIVRAAITDLYNAQQTSVDMLTPSASRAARLQKFVRKVVELDDRLRQWYQELPPKLRLENLEASTSTYRLREEIDADIGASGPRFERHIFQLQALALSLAFENARILIHRPLLSYKIIPPSPTGARDGSTIPLSVAADPFQRSIQTCREAALRTSEVGSTPAFHYASTTYAAAFFGMHLFTAGVTLCIMASLAPLSMQSQESKIGVHRLMEMQLSLKETSNLADQSVGILKKLAELLLQKEKEIMFQFSAISEESTRRVESPPHAPVVVNSLGHSGNDAGKSLPGSSNALTVVSQAAVLPETENKASKTTAGAAVGDYLGEMPIVSTMTDDIDFDFGENPSVTNMLMDMEQVMYDQSGNTNVSGDGLSDSYGPPSASDFIDQDQGWIWGVDFFPNSNG